MATIDPVAELIKQMTVAEDQPEVTDPEAQIQEQISHEDKERNLWALVNNFESQDQAHRDYWLRRIKKNFLFWDGKQRLYWSYMAGDWRQIPNSGPVNTNDTSLFDRYYNDNDRIVNIYKAHGETIISPGS